MCMHMNIPYCEINEKNNENLETHNDTPRENTSATREILFDSRYDGGGGGGDNGYCRWIRVSTQ